METNTSKKASNTTNRSSDSSALSGSKKKPTPSISNSLPFRSFHRQFLEREPKSSIDRVSERRKGRGVFRAFAHRRYCSLDQLPPCLPPWSTRNRIQCSRRLSGYARTSLLVDRKTRERRTSNVKRQTPNAKRQTPNVISDW